MPLALRIEAAAGSPFTVTSDTTIVIEPGNEQVAAVARYLAHVIATGTQPPPKVQTGSAAASGSILLSTDLQGRTMPAEGYELSVTSDGVRILAGEPAGLFYGVQTLRQLMPSVIDFEAARPQSVAIQPARIADAPRFGWRGSMLDVARHFFSVEEVKRYIDLLALYKLNRLHLHLSDDQGWRLEIRSWPNLTARGAATEVGGGPGGFYTQQQFAEIVTYARDRFITIVPEIDMPGHTNAALASYAELNCDGKARQPYTGIEVGFSSLCVESETTYRFIDDVVREIAALTPGAWFHIGGDEVKTLTPEQYRRFIERVQGIVQKHGKQMIGWDEVAPVSLLPSSIVQLWRPKSSPREAVQRGAKLILSPADRVYLDMKYDPTTPIGLDWAGLVEVRHAYDWDPATRLDGVPEASILGVEAPLWSETVANMSDVEFLVFPRLAAVAEIGWSAADRRDWADFAVRLAAQERRWSALGLNFYRSPQVPWQR